MVENFYIFRKVSNRWNKEMGERVKIKKCRFSLLFMEVEVPIFWMWFVKPRMPSVQNYYFIGSWVIIEFQHPVKSKGPPVLNCFYDGQGLTFDDYWLILVVLGSISPTCLLAALTYADPKSAKGSLNWLSFCAFGICARKSCV